MDHLCKLVKEAEDCGVALSCDIIGATLAYRTGIAKAWLSRCRQVPRQPLCFSRPMEVSSHVIVSCCDFKQNT